MAALASREHALSRSGDLQLPRDTYKRTSQAVVTNFGRFRLRSFKHAMLQFTAIVGVKDVRVVKVSVPGTSW